MVWLFHTDFLVCGICSWLLYNLDNGRQYFLLSFAHSILGMMGIIVVQSFTFRNPCEILMPPILSLFSNPFYCTYHNKLVSMGNDGTIISDNLALVKYMCT